MQLLYIIKVRTDCRGFRSGDLNDAMSNYSRLALLVLLSSLLIF